MNLTSTKKTLCLLVLNFCFLLVLIPSISAQKATNSVKSKPKTQQAPPLEVVVYQNGKITFKGKGIAFDDVKKEVQRVASTFKNIPDKIPMRTVGEVGMGTRHEVETRISEGIAAAKWVRKKATLTTQESKTTQTPKRIDFKKEKSNSLVWEEKVAAKASKVFVFKATKGQKLTIGFIDDTKQGSMDLGKFSIEPNTDPFQMTIDVTKDYRLSVTNNSDKATSFRISISLENPQTVSAKGEKLDIGSFSKLPSDIDGCSCTFSDVNEKSKDKYVYADNWEKLAFVNINGVMTKLTLKKTNQKTTAPKVKNVANKEVKTYGNGNYEVTVDIVKGKQVDETWAYKGTMTVKSKSGKTVVKSIKGICGC
ncbi:MAG: hypothetical protein JNL70_25175 [Saprospiraceae bacterium]|nr:hypothetical protein [Saprospiraceae bacterium]